MNICLLKKEEAVLPLKLDDERAVHLIKVLHKKVGDSFHAGIIGDRAGTAVITKIDSGIHFTFTPESDGKPLYPLIMIIGFPRPIQLKRLLRDMAGLGVCQIHLIGTELGEKSYLKSDLATSQAGEQMLLDGTVQAAGTHIPILMRHEKLITCLDFLEIQFREKKPLLMGFDNLRPSCSISKFLSGCEHDTDSLYVAAIGSERGWTDNERKCLESRGFTLLGMGCRVLRTETAATVAASVILSSMGVI